MSTPWYTCFFITSYSACVSLSRFEKNGVANPDFPHVMKQRALDEGTHILVRETDLLGQANRVQGHAVVVRVGVAIALGDGAAQHLQSFEVRVPAGPPWCGPVSPAGLEITG